ncbi:MADS-box transcription factor family protein [Trifolium pratense]|uniref:MADS-box transcription factor family protein n=1 Tax=Trifolium pratense TaxID=57577 RepID=A0A2K3MI75_TRIPR|nr:MADS-box transcription factor family protein [Trifolium pratense]
MTGKSDSTKIAIQVEGPQNVNEESLILQRIAKGRTKLEKLKQENREKELELLMFKALRNNNMLANLTVDDSCSRLCGTTTC